MIVSANDEWKEVIFNDGENVPAGVRIGHHYNRSYVSWWRYSSTQVGVGNVKGKGVWKILAKEGGKPSGVIDEDMNEMLAGNLDNSRIVSPALSSGKIHPDVVKWIKAGGNPDDIVISIKSQDITRENRRFKEEINKIEI